MNNVVPKDMGRAKRRHQTESAIQRQVVIAKQNLAFYGKYSPSQLGRYRKLKAMDCGRPGCATCATPRRTQKGLTRLTYQEKRQLGFVADNRKAADRSEV